MAAAAEGSRHGRRVELRNAAAHDAEDALFHLDEHHKRPGICQIDDLVREVRDSIHVARPVDRRQEHVDPRDLVRLQPVEERREQLTLVLVERRVQERRQQLVLHLR